MFRLLTFSLFAGFLFNYSMALGCVCRFLITDSASINSRLVAHDIVAEVEVIDVLKFKSSFLSKINPLHIYQRHIGRKYSKHAVFKVNRLYKGSVTSDTIVIEGDQGSCSKWFKAGSTYLIFMNKHESSGYTFHKHLNRRNKKRLSKLIPSANLSYIFSTNQCNTISAENTGVLDYLNKWQRTPPPLLLVYAEEAICKAFAMRLPKLP